VDGLRIHARVSVERPLARAPAVVLVHGLIVSSRYMVPTAERLAPFVPVFAVDLPGFGRSDDPARTLDVPELADALASWMEASLLERAVLVGNSFGCQVIAELAARHPGRVAGVVLAGPSMDPRARNAPAEMLRLLADWPRERPSLTLIFLRDLLRAGLGRGWRTFRYALADRIEAKLPLVQAPALVVRGSRDPIVPERWAEEAARLLPRGRLAVIPGAPHAINYSAPDELVRILRSFLSENIESSPE
jgi:pimeloyl-ACP methyl ester carboxylesterase